MHIYSEMGSIEFKFDFPIVRLRPWLGSWPIIQSNAGEFTRKYSRFDHDGTALPNSRNGC